MERQHKQQRPNVSLVTVFFFFFFDDVALSEVVSLVRCELLLRVVEGRDTKREVCQI